MTVWKFEKFSLRFVWKKVAGWWRLANFSSSSSAIRLNIPHPILNLFCLVITSFVFFNLGNYTNSRSSRCDHSRKRQRPLWGIINWSFPLFLSSCKRSSLKKKLNSTSISMESPNYESFNFWSILGDPGGSYFFLPIFFARHAFDRDIRITIYEVSTCTRRGHRWP